APLRLRRPRRGAPRSGGGRRRRDRRRSRRGPRGPREGRSRGHRRHVPALERGPPPRRAAEMEPAMIGRLIALCARHRVLTIALVLFAAGAGVLALRRTPLDAVPDLSDVQVTIFTEWMGRSPDLIEDQIGYPIVTALVGAPHVTAVRGQSMFGMSFVNVVFQDGTDLYWARSRVTEYLAGIRARLPDGVTPILGPDATGVGCA